MLRAPAQPPGLTGQRLVKRTVLAVSVPLVLAAGG